MSISAIYYDVYNNGGGNLDMGHLQEHIATIISRGRDIRDRLSDPGDLRTLVDGLSALVSDHEEGWGIEDGMETLLEGMYPVLERVTDAVILVAKDLDDNN